MSKLFTVNRSLHGECSIYCDPDKDIHVIIVMTLPSRRIEDVEINYKLQGLKIHSIKEVNEYNIEEMQKKVHLTHKKHTKAFIMVASPVSILE